MPKQRTTRLDPAGTPPQPPRPVPSARLPVSGSDWLALAGIAICLALTWISRTALNVDGVAYLDLARLARSGDWDGFVQGYWSPLFPAIVAFLGTLVGATPTRLVALAHVVNGVSAAVGLALLWWWGRRTGRPFLTRTFLAVFLLASTGLPRIEAVTPDVLLLTLMAWVAYELVYHRGQRAVPSGLALGLAFLAKTSIWPWFILSIPLRLWGAGGAEGRRKILLSSSVAFLMVGMWIIPLSIESGRPTLGSAGRLNYAWYIESNDARTPDTHTGRHQAYHTVSVDSLHQVDVAEFASADRWTYAPWSDPTAWSAGIESSNAAPPVSGELLAYWGRQARRTFGFWMLPVLLGVLLPCAVVWWRPGVVGRLQHEDRPTAVALLLGLAGVIQFILVHSEPRLIAPFVLLFGLAALDVLTAEPPAGRTGHSPTRQVATIIGWVGVIWFSVLRIRTGMEGSARIQEAIASITAEQEQSRPGPPGPGRIVVAGPAMPVVPAAFLTGAHIVAQLPPRSLAVAQGLPPDRQLALLIQLFSGKAETVWVTDWNGAVRVVPIPTP